MRTLRSIAERFGFGTRKVGLAAAFVLLLSVAVITAGCGAEGRADTTDGTSTETQEAQSEEQAAEGEDATAETDEEDDGQIAVPVSVIPIEQGAVSAYLTATANLIAENEVMVLAEANGRVDRLLVDEGQYVRKGQLLASLMADDEKIVLAKAELKEANARRAYERGDDLATKELISREEIDKLQMEHEIAKQELAEAHWRIQKTEIRSPFSGQVSERMIQLGKHIQEGNELFQITDFDPLIARIYFPESDVMGLEDGREVRISVNADRSIQFAGRIRHVSNIVDTSTGTVKITVEAPDVPSGVRPGSFVTIDVVRETRTAALKLPKDAVIRELRSAHVFIAQDELAVKREVTLGLAEGEWIEALAGVEVGEQVIVLGQGSLKDGSKIKILSPTGEALQES